MEVDTLFEKTVGELERILTTKSVVGEPIELNGKTIIPLVSVGFGFGAGGGEGFESKGKGHGTGGGTGGGGGVRPVAVVVMDEHGVRVESIRGVASIVGKVADTVTELMRTRAGEAKAAPEPEHE